MRTWRQKHHEREVRWGWEMRRRDAPPVALWTKRVKASDVADMSPDVFVSSLIDVVRAGSFDLNKVSAEYSGLLALMLDRARAQTYKGGV